MGIEAILESLKAAFDEYKVPLPPTTPPPKLFKVGERAIFRPTETLVEICQSDPEGYGYYVSTATHSFHVTEGELRKLPRTDSPTPPPFRRAVAQYKYDECYHIVDTEKADPYAPVVDPDTTYSGELTGVVHDALSFISIPHPGDGWQLVDIGPIRESEICLRVKTDSKDNHPPRYYIITGEGCEPLYVTHQPGQLIVKEYSRVKFCRALLYQWKRIKTEEQPRPVYDGFPMLKALNFPAPAKRPADDLGE